jgi:hypothetical protein
MNELVVAAFAVVVAITVGMLLRRAGTRSSTLADLLRRPADDAADERPADLVELDRVLRLATMTAGGVHYRLRPLLRELADHRLRARGIRLDVDVDAARSALGPDVWELVRPERPAPDDRLAGGAAPSELERAVAALETL